jgi:hypothetical protein
MAGIMFQIGGLLEKGRNFQLADINLAVTVQSPRLFQESTRLVQYWQFNIGSMTRNPPICQI